MYMYLHVIALFAYLVHLLERVFIPSDQQSNALNTLLTIKLGENIHGKPTECF